MSLRAEMRETLRLAGPLAGVQLLSMAMVFVDSLFVGRVGPDALAAMSMSVGLLSLVEIVCIGLLSTLTVFVAQEAGAGRPRAVAHTVRRGLVMAFALGAAVVVLSTLSPWALRLLHQDASLIPLARDFLLALSLGMPGKLAFLALRNFCEGLSDIRPSVTVAACAVALNAALDYVMVLGRLGCPPLGLVGSGIATAMCSWGMFVALFVWVRRSPRYAAYRISGDDEDDGHSLAEIVRVGLPFSGSLLAEIAFFAFASFVMGSISVQAQAAHQVAIGAVSFLFMIPLGTSFALTIRVSRARGADDAVGVRRAVQAGLLVTAAMQTVSALLFLLAPDVVVSLYTHDGAIVPLATSLVRVAALFQLFDGVQVASMGILRGLVDAQVPFVITTFAYWAVGAPASLICAFWLGCGPQGVWYGFVVGLGLAALLLQLRIWKRLGALARTGVST